MSFIAEGGLKLRTPGLWVSLLIPTVSTNNSAFAIIKPKHLTRCQILSLIRNRNPPSYEFCCWIRLNLNNKCTKKRLLYSPTGTQTWKFLQQCTNSIWYSKECCARTNAPFRKKLLRGLEPDLSENTKFLDQIWYFPQLSLTIEPNHWQKPLNIICWRFLRIRWPRQDSNL